MKIDYLKDAINCFLKQRVQPQECTLVFSIEVWKQMRNETKWHQFTDEELERAKTAKNGFIGINNGVKCHLLPYLD